MEILVPLTWPVERRAPPSGDNNINSGSAHAMVVADQAKYQAQYLELLADGEVLSALFQLVIEPLSVNHRYVWCVIPLVWMPYAHVRFTCIVSARRSNRT